MKCIQRFSNLVTIWIDFEVNDVHIQAACRSRLIATIQHIKESLHHFRNITAQGGHLIANNIAARRRAV